MRSRINQVVAVSVAGTMALFAQAPQSAREPGLYATITTSLGDIVLRLYEEESPVTVRNFVELALGRKPWRDPKSGQTVERSLYDGLTFHRIMKGFMIQGGDPQGDGNGGTATIADELQPSLQFDIPGRLAMANSGPNTGSCQFFITEVPTPHLNGHHTIFGQVVAGQDVVSKIASVPTDPNNDRPETPVIIVGIKFQRAGPAPANDVMTPRPPGRAPAPGKSSQSR